MASALVLFGLRSSRASALPLAVSSSRSTTSSHSLSTSFGLLADFRQPSSFTNRFRGRFTPNTGDDDEDEDLKFRGSKDGDEDFDDDDDNDDDTDDGEEDAQSDEETWVDELAEQDEAVADSQDPGWQFRMTERRYMYGDVDGQEQSVSTPAQAMEKDDVEEDDGEEDYEDDDSDALDQEADLHVAETQVLNWGGAIGSVATGDFLKISRRQWQQLVPEYMPASFDVEADFDTDESIHILQREAVVRAINYAQEAAANGFTGRAATEQKNKTSDAAAQKQRAKGLHPIVFEPSGEGTGASTAMLLLVLWARMNGWLVAYVPDAPSLQGEKAEHFRITRSEVMPGCWDVPSHSAQFLQHQLAAHGDLLKTLPIKKSFVLDKGAFDPTNRSLYDLARYALDQYSVEKPGSITEALYHYRMELNRVTAVPVLLAVDRYNGWLLPSHFVDPDAVSFKTFDDVRKVHKPMPADRITNVRLFKAVGDLNCNLGNGLSAVALSRRGISKKIFATCSAQLEPVVPRSRRYRLDPYSFDEFSSVHWRYLQLAMMDPEASWHWGPVKPESIADVDEVRQQPLLPEHQHSVPRSAVKHAYTLTSGYPSELVRLRGLQMFVLKGEENKRIRLPF